MSGNIAKICPRCKHEATIDSSYCQHCGTELISTTITAKTTVNIITKPEQLIICPICKREATHGSFYCQHCGGKLININVVDCLVQNAEINDKKSNSFVRHIPLVIRKKWWLMLISFIILPLLCIPFQGFEKVSTRIITILISSLIFSILVSCLDKAKK